MQATTGITDIAHTIQMAEAPVFLLSGVGVFLTVLTNRLARVIDRARIVEAAQEATPQVDIDGRRAELRVLSRRARLASLAITLSTTCALLICVVIVTLFAGAALGEHLSMLIVVLFIAALCSLIGGLVVFLLEIRVAEESLRFGSASHVKSTGTKSSG